MIFCIRYTDFNVLFKLTKLFDFFYFKGELSETGELQIINNIKKRFFEDHIYV